MVVIVSWALCFSSYQLRDVPFHFFSRRLVVSSSRRLYHVRVRIASTRASFSLAGTWPSGSGEKDCRCLLDAWSA